MSLTSETNEETPKVTKAASSATFHGWKDVDLIVRSNEIEVDEDDLNEGFCTMGYCRTKPHVFVCTAVCSKIR